jgi:hypothetical protein
MPYTVEPIGCVAASRLHAEDVYWGAVRRFFLTKIDQSKDLK